MRQLIFLSLMFISTALLAQTKRIAFESHSGNMENFNIALENNLFNSDESNFGLPPNHTTYQLDSVIYLSSTKSVLVKRTYTREYREPKDSDRLVEVRRDTVYDHPLFARNHSLDSIKNVIKNNGQFSNRVNDVVFVGYDNKKPKEKKKNNKKNEKDENNMIPVVVIDNNNNGNHSPFDIQLATILGSILLLSAAGGLLSWKFYQPRLQKA